MIEFTEEAVEKIAQAWAKAAYDSSLSLGRDESVAYSDVFVAIDGDKYEFAFRTLFRTKKEYDWNEWEDWWYEVPVEVDFFEDVEVWVNDDGLEGVNPYGEMPQLEDIESRARELVNEWLPA